MTSLEVGLNLSLSTPLRFPVRIRVLDGVPKILAGGIPVAPLNLVLVQRQREKGSTQASLDTYARAARLYVEFCAHRLGLSSRSQMRSLFGSKTHYWGILFLIAMGNWSDWTGKEGDEQLT